MDAEIIVIDNNSPDDSCEMIKTQFPNIHLIENKENVGFSKANNQGVAIAKGDYICILNPDTVIGEKTFTQMLNVQQKLSVTGIIGCRLIDGTGSYLPESKRNIPSPLTSFGRLFGVKLGNAKSYYADDVDHVSIGEVEILVGAFMWCKKSDYLLVGGFDEDYFMYGEDIDLSYKIIKSGLHNYYVGSISVIHYKGESTDRNATYIKRFYGAMQIFYKKHFKTNWVLNSLVSIGIKMLTIVKSIPAKKQEKRKIVQYYLISEDKKLKSALEKVLTAPITMISILSTKNLNETSTEVIFDNDFINFETIIQYMLDLKSEFRTFKIKPTGRNYMVGSNNCDDKGEIIHF